MLWHSASVDAPTRHRRARGGGPEREIAMLGSSCFSPRWRCSASSSQHGVCASRVTALGVGVLSSRRSGAAVASSYNYKAASSRLAAPLTQRRAAAPARSSPEVVIDVTMSMQQRHDARRCERARDVAERMRINEAQADERARVDAQHAAALARDVQLQAERDAAAERERAGRARAEAARVKNAAAERERELDAAALLAAEQAVDARHAAAALSHAAHRRRRAAAAASSPSSTTTSGSLFLLEEFPPLPAKPLQPSREWCVSFPCHVYIGLGLGSGLGLG